MSLYQHIRTQQTPFSYQKHILQNPPSQSRIRTYPHTYQLSNPINSPLSHSSSTKSTTKSNHYFIYDEGYDRKNLKRMLYEDYEAQVRVKREKDSLQQMQEKQLEKKLLQKAEEIHARIQWHDHQQKLTKQRQISEDYRHKQQLNKYTKQLQSQMKNKQRLQLQNKKPTNKRALFEQFFTNCNQGMKMNSKMYLDKVVPIQHRRQVEKDKLTLAGINKIADKYNNMYQKIQLENGRKVTELRTQLSDQRRHNDEMRRYNSEQKLHSHHETTKANYHDPIVNPVNLGVNPQNKYVVAEIRKSIERSGSTNSRDLVQSAKNNSMKPEGTISRKGLSQLARNGSHVLL